MAEEQTPEEFEGEPEDPGLVEDVAAFLAGKTRRVDADGVIHEEPFVHPWGGMHPPDDDDFEPFAYLAAPALADTAARLIGAHKRLEFLSNFALVYLWQREGGMQGSSAILGRCARPSGLAAHFVPAHWVITLSADHIRSLLLAPTQVEAVLFHELCHCQLTAKGKPALRPHDWSGFQAEIEAYGLYLPDIRGMERVFRQLRLKATPE